jgi:hypothetical protein
MCAAFEHFFRFFHNWQLARKLAGTSASGSAFKHWQTSIAISAWLS